MHLLIELTETIAIKKHYLICTSGIALFAIAMLVLINQFSLLPLPIPKQGIGFGHTGPQIDTRSDSAFKEAVARIHRHGIGFEDPQADGAPWGLEEVLKMAVDQGYSGNPDAEYLIGWMFETHECFDLEHIDLVNQVTRMFEFNWLSDRRLHLATQWYQLACEHGSIPAAAELGYMYQEGLGVPVNYTLAAKWYQKAADAGDGQAQIDLGWMYENGLGVKTDPARAMTLYEKAANGNYSIQGKISVERLWAASGTTPSTNFSRGKSSAVDFVTKYGNFWEAGCLAQHYDPGPFIETENDKTIRYRTYDAQNALSLYKLARSLNTHPTYGRTEADFLGTVDQRTEELEKVPGSIPRHRI